MCFCHRAFCGVVLICFCHKNTTINTQLEELFQFRFFLEALNFLLLQIHNAILTRCWEIKRCANQLHLNKFNDKLLLAFLIRKSNNFTFKSRNYIIWVWKKSIHKSLKKKVDKIYFFAFYFKQKSFICLSNWKLSAKA